MRSVGRRVVGGGPAGVGGVPHCEGGLLLVVQRGGRRGRARVRRVRPRAGHGRGLAAVAALLLHEVRIARHPFYKCHSAQHEIIF